MKVQTLVVGELQSNCHIVINEELKSVVLVDCGGEPQKILNYVENLGLKISAILLTHGHYDHFEGVAKVQEVTDCKVYISKFDSVMLTSREHSLANLLDYDTFQPVEKFITVGEGDIIKESGFEFKVLSTAGHTSGSVCYICEDCLFTGDTLFKRSMGRTDFPTGSYLDMQKSLRRLHDLNGNFKIYAGHNGNTDLQSERLLNGCMYDAMRDDFYLY